nr:reverse transcriptase domain-containing protein [Tanacetum cinerariifolium]
MILGSSVPSSSPKGGYEISKQGEKLYAFNDLEVGDSVHESEDSHAFWGSFNMPTFSFKSLHKIFRGFLFSLLDVVDLYWILDALLLLKPMKHISFLLSSCLRLGDADLFRRILEKTLVGSGLLDALRERLGFSLPCASRSPEPTSVFSKIRRNRSASPRPRQEDKRNEMCFIGWGKRKKRVRILRKPLPGFSFTKNGATHRKKSTSIVESDIQTNAAMADNRTMAQMLQAPIEGYKDAIVVPPINANNFELKQTLINLVQLKKAQEKDKIGSKPDKNGKRGEAGKSRK